MEIERYSWSFGSIRSDWLYIEPDDAQKAASEWLKSMKYHPAAEIKIWRKLIEEIII